MADEVFHVQNIMTLQDLISGPLGRIRAGMRSTEAVTGSITAKLVTFTKKMAKAAIIGGVFLTAFTGIAMAVIPTQKALGELSSVGIKDMAVMEAAAVSFSNQFSGTVKPDFLAAAYDIKSGIASLSDAGVAEFTKLAALTGKATKSTTAEMTSLFATGYGIYKNYYSKMSDFEFGEMFSAGIAGSVKQFKTTGSAMAAAISNLGASATTSNVPLREQLTILGMLQGSMSSGERAGTAYRALVENIAKAGKRLKLPFLDANNQIKSLPDILDVLRSKFGAVLDDVEKDKLTTAFGREAVAPINLLYGKIGSLRGNIQSLSIAMGQGQGFTHAMAQTMNRDLGANISIAKQMFGNLVEMIGGMFAPALNSTIKAIRGVVGWMMSWIERNSELAKTVLYFVGGLSIAVVGVTALSAAGAGLGIVMAWLGGTLAAVSWPVWALIGVIGILYLAWRSNFGGMADTLSAFYSKASLVIRGVVMLFKNLSAGQSFLSGELGKEIKADGLLGFVATTFQVLVRVKEFVGGIWEVFYSTFAPVFSVLGKVLVSLGSAIGPLVSLFGQITGGFFGMSTSMDVSGWRTFGLVIGHIVTGPFKLLAWSIQIAGNLLSWFLNLIGRVAQGISDAFSGGVVSAIGGLVKTIGGAFGKVADLIPHSDAKEGPLSRLTQSGKSLMYTLGEGVTLGAPGLKKSVATALAAAAITTTMNITSPSIEPKKTSGDGGKKTTIIIQNITLPGVQNGGDFVAELKKLVEQYDA